MPVQDRARLLGRIQRKVLPRVRGALPAMAGECEAFAVELGRIATTLPSATAVTVHGDLHTGNILLDGSGLVLIDLDSLASGEPAFDLAMIGTRLMLLAMLGDGGLRETASAVADLPRYYADAGGDQVAPGVFAWYVAALLVGRQIKTGINNLSPGLDDLARRLLDRAGAVLAAGKVDAGVLAGP
jgi:aminoglycoside phosphotransferase (APT) family kinase protein